MSGRLPNFLIIGAMKSGTTSLAAWLREHPQVFVSEQKELYFFQDHPNRQRGLGWYREQFAASAQAIAVGEASPTYLYSPVAPERIEQTLGRDLRLVATLRDPVDRAYSHFLHWREREVSEPRSFSEAVEAELKTWSGELRPIDRHGSPPQFGYLDHGHYVPQLKRYAQRFGRENLLVVLLDDLEADPEATYRRICRHLGVDDSVVPDAVGRPENQYHTFRPAWLFRFMVRHGIFARMPNRLGKWLALDVMTPKVKARPPLDARLRRRLCEHFAAPNAELADWLGRDLSHWSQP